MPKTQPEVVVETKPAEAPAPEQPTVASAPIEALDYPRDLYDAAHIENGHRDFNNRLVAARGPSAKPAYVTPEVPAAVKTQTQLELEAGRKRVAEFEEIEAKRKAIAHRVPDKWEGHSTPIFRPGNFVPDPKKLQGSNLQPRTVA